MQACLISGGGGGVATLVEGYGLPINGVNPEYDKVINRGMNRNQCKLKGYEWLIAKKIIDKKYIYCVIYII